MGKRCSYFPKMNPVLSELRPEVFITDDPGIYIEDIRIPCQVDSSDAWQQKSA
jgi:hypothetical protein